jgi:hypothetical protein
VPFPPMRFQTLSAVFFHDPPRALPGNETPYALRCPGHGS